MYKNPNYKKKTTKLETAKKQIKKTLEKTKTKLDNIKPEAKRKIRNTGFGLLTGAIMLGGGIKATKIIIKNKEKNKITAENKKIENKIEKEYEITDLASFDSLFTASLPFIQTILLPTEHLVFGAYSDNNSGVLNSIGLGSYYYPVDGDPHNSEWDLLSTLIKNKTISSNLKISADKAFELCEGWFKYREGGRIYKSLYKKLKGTKLNTHEFASIASCIYNSEKCGNKFADFVKENYDNPIDCAKFLIKNETENYKSGIHKRRIHEVFIYLNLDNYCLDVFNLELNEGISSKGKKYYRTSISVLSDNSYDKVKKDLEKAKKINDLEECKKVKNHIVKYTFKRAICLSDFINKEVKTPSLKNKLLSFCPKTLNYIEECKQVLETGEYDLYSAANYNSGLAYEAMGEYTKALKNYELAEKRNPGNKTYKNSITRTQKFIFSKNKSR